MFSPEDSCFIIEENENEFQEICSRLKDHAFPSPWSIFFKSSSQHEFTSEVSEFTINNDSLMERDENVINPSPDDSAETNSLKNHMKDVQLDKKKVCRLRECLMSAQDDNTVNHLKDFDIFFVTQSSEIPELFQILDVLNLSDAALNLLLNSFLQLKDKISIATALGFVHFVIGPLVFDLKRNSSRFFLATIMKFAEIYPKAIVDEILIPYSESTASDDLKSEIILQIAKTSLPDEYVSYGLRRVLEHAVPADNSFAVLQSLIERKIYHDTILYDLLLQKLLVWTSTCNKNVKFTKLLTSILSAYGHEFTDQQISLCDGVIKSNKTIIKRAAENLLKKLKAEKV